MLEKKFEIKKNVSDKQKIKSKEKNKNKNKK